MTRVLLVGISGASCSGKTLLAKHIARLVPGSVLVHQDDFAPPSERVPVHPVHGVQDWDDAETGIEWPRLREFLADVKARGALPEGFESYDHLNNQVEVGVDDAVAQTWRQRLEAAPHQDIRVVLVDGFLLYYDQLVADAIDVRIMLRVPHDKLKQRREARAVYVLQNAEDAAAGGVWEDPPGYFDNIVYPAYVKAHQHVFSGGDVECGGVRDETGIVLIDPAEGEAGMTQALERACAAVVQALDEGKGSVAS